MDIAKICRCCLSLNSLPLLSIYDGESGSGCVANMLMEIAKLKPHQNDKMPENACLSCISEINKCYVFKVKCESSNKTLRQLLPDAVKEYFDVPEQQPQQKVSLSDAGVQTEEQSLKNVHVQTVEEEKATTIRREVEVQTDDYPTVFVEETYENIFEPAHSEELLVCEKIESTVIKRRPSTYSSPSRLQSPPKKKIRLEKNVQNLSGEEDQKSTDLPETYIVVETINNESNSSDEPQFFIQNSDADRDETIRVENESNSTCRYEYYDGITDETVESPERKSNSFQENDYIYNNDVTNDSSNERVRQEESNCPKDLSELSPQSPTQPLVPNSRRSSSQRRGQHKCSLCIMTFVSLKVLRRHLAKRHSTTQTEIVSEMVAAEEIPVIENISSSLHNLTNNQVELTMENVPNPRLLPRSRDKNSAKVDEQLYTKFQYYCDYCQAGFAQRKTLAYHMKQNICMTSNFKCNQCDRIFISQENLEAHKDTHNSQHTCLECNKACSSVEELSEHMIENHNRNARNQCHVCKKVFTMKASLLDHLRIHSGEKPFLCTVCGKSFRQNSNLRQHLMRHTNEKNFKCDMPNCSNAYVTKAELFSHKRTHTGDHPFKCETCSTCFTSSSSLQKHRRKHTGERPYQCEFCPMRFAALNVLKNHRRTHTGERPYKCDFCDKCFTQKGDCLLHQRTHEFGEVRCFCGSKFSKITNLRQHIKNKHPNMTDEKRRELNDTLNKKCNESGTELHITLLEEGEDMDEEGETSHFVTISSIDNSFLKSQHPEVADDNEESTEIIMEDIN